MNLVSYLSITKHYSTLQNASLSTCYSNYCGSLQGKLCHIEPPPKVTFRPSFGSVFVDIDLQRSLASALIPDNNLTSCCVQSALSMTHASLVGTFFIVSFSG